MRAATPEGTSASGPVVQPATANSTSKASAAVKVLTPDVCILISNHCIAHLPNLQGLPVKQTVAPHLLNPHCRQAQAGLRAHVDNTPMIAQLAGVAAVLETRLCSPELPSLMPAKAGRRATRMFLSAGYHSRIRSTARLVCGRRHCKSFMLIISKRCTHNSRRQPVPHRPLMHLIYLPETKCPR